MKNQKDLELFIIDYLTDHIDDVEEDYYKAQLEDVMCNIRDTVSGHPLANKIITAIEEADYSESDNVFIKALDRISNKLGYR